MSDRNEEEYLDQLLNSMSGKIAGDADHEDNSELMAALQDLNEEILPEEEPENEAEESVDDMAFLSGLLDSMNLNTEVETIEADNKEPLVEDDSEPFSEPFSLDETVTEMEMPMESSETSLTDERILEFSMDEILPENPPEEESLQEDSEHTEDDDSRLIEPLDIEFHEDITVEHEETSESDDMMDDIQSILESKMKEEQEKDGFQEMDRLEEIALPGEERIRGDADIITEIDPELADILALEEGMTVADIPKESDEGPLSDEELLKISSMDMFAEEPSVLTEESANVTIDTGIEMEEDKKKKKKFSLKAFFMKFNDDDEEDKEKAPVDENQQLINELYAETDSLDKVDPEEEDSKKKKKEKKPKKEKEAKEKKPKKEKKAKEPIPASERVKFGPGTIIKIVLFVAVIVVVVKVLGGIFTYNVTVQGAKDNYANKNYVAAYEKLSGLSVKSSDKNFYMQVRTIMSVYQGYLSYENYMSMKKTPEAIDALINAVGRKNALSSQTEEYKVTDQVDEVYKSVLDTLAKYKIDEKKALDLYAMTSHSEYYKLLKSYGGVSSDSNN